MANSKKDPVIDLANRAHALRTRIWHTERKLAIAYPDQREALEQDIERSRAMLADIEEDVEKAKEQVRTEVISAVDAYFSSRSRLLRLLGYMNDPGFADSIFAHVAMGAEATQDALSVKAALMSAVEVEEAPAPQISDVDRDHEEKVRNMRAGKGYRSDGDLQRIAEEGEFAVMHGAGARPGGALVKETASE
jgi:hypothetical protein